MKNSEHFETRFKNNQPAVIAVFKDHNFLERTLSNLKENNFNNNDISIVMAKRGDVEEHANDYHLGKSAIQGLLGGMLTGALFNMLTGTKKGHSPFKSTVQWALYGGAIGSMGAPLIKYGISVRESKKLESYIKDKGIIISVYVDNPRELLVAKNILVTNGAVKIFNPYEEEFANI